MTRTRNRLAAAFLFALALVALAPVPASAQSLLNGGFESGSTGWVPVTLGSGAATTVDLTEAYAGSASARVEMDSDTTEVAGWFQPIAVQAGHHYEFEFAVKTDDLHLMARPLLSHVDGGGSGSETIVYEQDVFAVGGTTNWTTATCRFTVPPGADQLNVFLLVYGTRGTAWFDEIALTQKTDPTAVPLYVDLSTSVGVWRPLNSTNAGSNAADLQQLGVDMVRTHDYYGPCDISTIFPDLSADPTDPAAYDFAASDAVISTLVGAGHDVLFRLGESWEEFPVHNVPPADFAKWAEVCVHIARHYNDGWNQGFHYDITHWEIWNEPDADRFWTGTAAEYAELYHRTADALKAYDPSLRVGGPALANPASADFLATFLDTVAVGGAPLDFFSYHHYDFSNPYFFARTDSAMASALAARGVTPAETFVTEWNSYVYRDGILDWGRDDALNAAQTAAALTYLQDSPVTRAFRYRTDDFPFGLMRSPGVPSYSGQLFQALRQFAPGAPRLATTGSDSLGTTVLAVEGADEGAFHLLISNNTSPADGYRLHLDHPSPGTLYAFDLFRIDEAREYALVSTGFVNSASPFLDVSVAAPFVDHLVIAPTIATSTLGTPSSSPHLFPNPSRDAVEIRYTTERRGPVRLTIHDVQGRTVRTWATNGIAAGDHVFSWDGRDGQRRPVASGIYFYRLQLPGAEETVRKLVRVR